MQGEVSAHEAAKVAGDLFDMGCYEVSMGDTIGVATPASTVQLFEVRLTMRFRSTAKVLAKCKLKYYRISECVCPGWLKAGQRLLKGWTCATWGTCVRLEPAD